MENFIVPIITGLGKLLLIFVWSLLMAWPVMLLWNWLMPDLFGLMVLDFKQSWGLMLLCGLLFKS